MLVLEMIDFQNAVSWILDSPAKPICRFLHPPAIGCGSLFWFSMSVTHQADGFLPPPTSSSPIPRGTPVCQGQLRHPLLSPTFPHPSCVQLFFLIPFFHRPARSLLGHLLKDYTRDPVVSGFAGLIGSRQTGLKPHWGRCLSAGKKARISLGLLPSRVSLLHGGRQLMAVRRPGHRAASSDTFPTLARVQ